MFTYRKLSDLKKNSYNKYTDWHDMLSDSVSAAEELAKYLPADINEIRRVTQRYPMRINPYYLSLMINKGDQLRRQAVPDLGEI